MKKTIVYILMVTVICCARPRNEKDLMEKEVSTEAISMDAKEVFQYQNMSQQKLQDLFDLLVLQKKHPEFKDNISYQLKEISEDKILISDSIDAISIKNIGVIQSVKRLNDSTQTLKIDFDVRSNLGTSKDSLLVIIKTKKIVLDNQDLESNKLMFKKLE